MPRRKQDADDLLGRVMLLLHRWFPFFGRKPSHFRWTSSWGPNQMRLIEKLVLQIDTFEARSVGRVFFKIATDCFDPI